MGNLCAQLSMKADNMAITIQLVLTGNRFVVGFETILPFRGSYK